MSGQSPAQRKREKERCRERKAWLASIKLERGCINCGYKEHAEALEFHHLDPTTKSFGLAHAGTRAHQRILDEIAKCIVICANCHAVLHAKEA